MILEIDTDMADEIMARLRTKYGSSQRKVSRDGIHLTSLIYCITKAFWQDKLDFQPTDEEVLYWAIGLGLEDILLRDTNIARPAPKVVDGITVSIDYQMIMQGALGEMKASRLGITQSMPTKGLPDTWIEQMKGYSYAFSVEVYRLAILQVIQAKLYGYKLTFDKQELVDYWQYLLSRKQVLDKALATGLPPEPFAFCKDWECARCAGLTMCQAFKASGDYIAKEQM